MNSLEIYNEIKKQLIQDQPIEDIMDSVDYYNDILQGIPQKESIKSFLIGINTSGNQMLPDSNITIITFEDNILFLHNNLILFYIQEIVNEQQGLLGYSILGNQLILSFDY